MSRLEAVFNALAQAVAGDEVQVTTQAGTLRYQVIEALPPVLKEDLPSTPEVADAVPGRLVLIGRHRDED
ncbi:hypothetical protein J5O08_00795 [Cellulomonas sp. PS-H5]|nr:hypothetical protein [Cellulomonas sp. PS-H5]